MTQRRIRRRNVIRGVGQGAGVALLSACSGPLGRIGADSTPDGAPASRGGARPKLTMWCADPGEMELKQWLIDTVNQAGKQGNFDITVEYFDIATLARKEIAGLEAKMMPDLSLTFLATRWAQAGWARDVNDLYIEIGREGGDWYGAADSISQMSGRRIGIPIVLDINILFARADLFSAAGFTLPFATFDDLIAGFKQVTRGAVYGFGAPYREMSAKPVLDVVFAHGGRLFDKNSKPTIDTPRNRAGFAAFADLAVAYQVMPPGSAQWDSGQAMKAYLADQVAAISTSPVLIQLMRSQREDLLATTVAMPWPAPRDGVPGVAADGPQFVVNQHSPHSAEALQVVRQLMSKQSYPALLEAIDPFGFSVLQGYKDIDVYARDPLMRQIQHEVAPHAVSRYADGIRTPVLDAISTTIDTEVSQMAARRTSLTEAMASIDAQAQAAYAESQQQASR